MADITEENTTPTVVSNDKTNSSRPGWLFPLATVAAFVLLGSLTLWYVSAATTTYSLWSNSAVPKTLSDTDSNSLELGVKFKANVSGQVTGVKFYKGAQNTGTHTGSLWTNDGRRLATVTFTGETASGWQTAHFAQPISIAANALYTISYHTPNGHYSWTNNYFKYKSLVSGPLTAPKSTYKVQNGVYSYNNNITFPSVTSQQRNYWVDVLFEAKTISPVAKPAPPTSITATQSGSAINLTWAAATSANPISKYIVIRNGTEIGSVTNFALQVTYKDSNVTAGTTYSYQVKTVDNTNVTSDPSQTASVTYNATPSPTPTPTPTPPPTPVPTPTPTPIPTPVSSSCTAKPDASNTGASGTLGTYTGPTTITTAGTVIQNVRVSGGLTIQAPNVTIRNVIVDGISIIRVRGTRISNVTLSGIYSSSGGDIVIDKTNIGYTTDGDGMHVTSDNGIYITDVTLTNSWIHDPRPAPTEHWDGIQVRGASNVLIQCNNYDLGPFQQPLNSAIYFEDANGGNNNYKVDRNWLNGGGYSLYLGTHGSGYAELTNNIFGTQAGYGNCFDSSNTNWLPTLQQGNKNSAGQAIDPVCIHR